jgi:hypothetical protein
VPSFLWIMRATSLSPPDVSSHLSLDQEEKAKKQQRAQRYGLATAAKDEGDEERKRRLRAERFGVVDQVLPEEAATMEVGKPDASLSCCCLESRSQAAIQEIVSSAEYSGIWYLVF